MPIIRTKRFILRPIKKSDIKLIAKHANDKIVARNTLSIPHPYKLKDAKIWVNKNLDNYKKKEKTDVTFAIEIDGKFAGGVGLHKIAKNHKAEIGYWLGRPYWNRGIMTEAVKVVTKFGFEKLKLRRIYAPVFLFNEPSKKVLEKAGYKLEGIVRKEAKKGDKYIDAYMLAKVR
jgi:[ribosomal protein S5]-alanine N-acetyltransferase